MSSGGALSHGRRRTAVIPPGNPGRWFGIGWFGSGWFGRRWFR